MSKGKTRLGLAGLCVTAAMAMMAFTASGAQAAGCTAATPTAKPCWMVNSTNVTSDLAVTLEIKEDTLTKLLSHAIGLNIAIDCKKFEGHNVVLHAEGKANGEIWFSECETYLEGALSAVCKPNEPIKAGGTIEIALHAGVTYLKATGAGGKFTTIVFGPECSIEETEITGTAWIKDCESHAETEQLIHLIEEGMTPALALEGLKFGEEPASIDGSVNVELFDGGMKTFSVLAG